MSDKGLIITGASKGIGAATAEQFLQDGFEVINLSRSAPKNSDIEHIEIDLSNLNGLHDIARALAGKVEDWTQTVVIHNAAVLSEGSSQDLDLEAFRQAMDINVAAPAVLNAALLPHMTEGSSILFVGSTLSEKAVPGSQSYVTTKHAGLGLMRALCQDLVGTGIHTACICPGFTDTEMLREHVGGDADVLRSIAAGNTLGRLVDPAEIAETLFFCAHSPVMNGSTVHANLGQIES